MTSPSELENHPQFEKTNSANVLLRVLAGVVFFAGILLLAGMQFEPSWDAYTYALKYHITMDRAHCLPKPKDCDWGQPPIGDKSCHYEKRVMLKVVLRTSVGQDMHEDLDEKQYREALAERGPYDLPGPVPVVRDVYINWLKIEDH